MILDRRSSSGSSPSHSPRLSEKSIIENEFQADKDLKDNKDHLLNRSPKSRNKLNNQIFPKAISTLVTNNKNVEGKLNLVAPIAVTEELEVDDCETESDANEGKTNANILLNF